MADDRHNIKLSPEVYELLKEEKGRQNWDAFLLDLLEEDETQDRQADALELIAGMLMVDYSYNSDRPDFSPEALEREARHHASGGEIQ